MEENKTITVDLFGYETYSVPAAAAQVIRINAQIEFDRKLRRNLRGVYIPSEVQRTLQDVFRQTWQED